MADMHTASVTLQEGMHFQGSAGDDFTIHLDASKQHGGQGLGSSSQSLMLVSLAGCTAMDVISILRKKRQAVDGLEVWVKAERAEEHPKVYTHIWVTYRVSGQGIDPAAVARSIELSMTKYCPVAGMLNQVVPIETDFEIAPG
jgi:putative redox protein